MRRHHARTCTSDSLASTHSQQESLREACRSEPFECVQHRRMFNTFNISGAVHHFAASNYVGKSWHRRDMGAGVESMVLGAGNRSREATIKVAVRTVDWFVASERLDHVSLLSIDAEGQDGLIIEGSRQLLASRRVDVVEFEYRRKLGSWGRIPDSLSKTLSLLYGFGYECFWQGEASSPIFGALALANGPGWCPLYANISKRANVVCSHLDAVQRRLRSLAEPPASAEHMQLRNREVTKAINTHQIRWA